MSAAEFAPALAFPAGRPFAFLHTADLHLDAPLKGLRGEQPRLARALRQARRNALAKVARRAVEGSAAFWVLAGDIFDGPRPSLGARRDLLRALEEATAAGVQCFLACGNHDPASRWPEDLHLPPGAHLFSAQEVESFDVQRDGAPLARVAGLSHGRGGETANLARRFPPPPPDLFSVAVLHAQVGPGSVHGPYAPASLSDLAARGYHYWALGHVHRRQVVERRPWVVYPGFLQGRSMRETGAGGGVWVAVDGAGEVEVTAVESDGVRFAIVEVEVEALGQRVDQLLEGLARARDAQRWPSSDEPRGVMLRLRLTGRTALHRQLAHPALREELLEALRDGETQRDDFVWVEGVEAHTTAPLTPGVPSGPLGREIRRLAHDLREDGETLQSWLRDARESAAVGPLLDAWPAATLNEVLADAEVLIDDVLLDEGLT